MSNSHENHRYESSDYWMRTHSEPAVLDIGEDIGALVLYTGPELHGHEIEVSPRGQDAQRTHAAVLARRANGRTVFAAVYPELRAGEYRIWSAGPSQISAVTVVGGRVAEVNWR